MTIQEAKLFLRNYKNYERIFSQERLVEIFKMFDVKDFQTRKTIRCQGGTDNYYSRQGYTETGRGQRIFKEYKGEWSREVKDFGIDYLVPCDYQTRENKVLEACLLDAFPYLKDFDKSIYKLDNEKENEFYIKCENGCSLYVPISALLNNNKQIIIDRMTTYFKWYYNSPDRKEYLDKELATLETETAKKLFDILDSLK